VGHLCALFSLSRRSAMRWRSSTSPFPYRAVWLPADLTRPDVFTLAPWRSLALSLSLRDAVANTACRTRGSCLSPAVHSAQSAGQGGAPVPIGGGQAEGSRSLAAHIRPAQVSERPPHSSASDYIWSLTKLFLYAGWMCLMGQREKGTYCLARFPSLKFRWMHICIL
jgi:hypothetical protein